MKYHSDKEEAYLPQTFAACTKYREKYNYLGTKMIRFIWNKTLANQICYLVYLLFNLIYKIESYALSKISDIYNYIIK